MAKKPTYEELEQRIRELEKAELEREQAVEEVSWKEAQYRVIFEASKDTFLIFDMDGILKEVNPAACDMYGYSYEEMIGLSGKDIVHPDYRYLYKDALEKTTADQQINAESVDIHKDGSPFDVEIKGCGFEYNGKPHILAVVRDITEYKQAEKVLRESEEQYRKFIDNAPVAMYTINIKGEFTYGNRKLLEMTGYKREDWQDKSFAPIVHPEDLDIVLEKIQKRISGQGTQDPYELRIHHSSGEIIWVKITSESIYEIDENGTKRLTGMQSFVEDITSRKAAEEALQESENKFRYLFESSPQPITLTDLKTRKFIDVNDKECELTKYNREELLGKTAIEVGLITEEDNKIFRKELNKSGEVNRLEMDFRAKDGSVLTAMIFSRIVQIAGESLILTIFHDITDEKRLKNQLQQAQKMEAIGTLAGGIAHDFNNVLYSIIGYSELTMDDVPDGSLAQSNLKEVLNGALRAKDMIKQILAFSRKGDTAKKPIKVQSVVMEALKFLRTSIPKTIEIQQNIDADCGPILADSTQIHQVVMNLSTNAYQAMREKGGVLELTLMEVQIGSNDSGLDLDPGTYLKLTVSDTGHGINGSVMDKIFDPYFTTKGPGEGTGMGLAVVHGIVKDHGGDIKVYSELDEGTTFSVYLPLIETRPVEEITATAEFAATGTERILFVDDEEYLVFMTQQILERLGYQVSSRTSSVEALEAFKAKPDEYDLVITDMTMPNMTGVELSARLREIRSDIPIILCTGFSEMIDEDKARNMGISAYIMKPILKDEIAGAIRKVLDKGN